MVTNFSSEHVAAELLKYERDAFKQIEPKPPRVMVKWWGRSYTGYIEEIAPDYSREIVLLTKTSHPLPNDLANAIRKLDTGRIDLEADNSLDLNNRCVVMRFTGNRLTSMTPEQTRYVKENLPEYDL